MVSLEEVQRLLQQSRQFEDSVTNGAFAQEMSEKAAMEVAHQPAYPATLETDKTSMAGLLSGFYPQLARGDASLTAIQEAYAHMVPVETREYANAAWGALGRIWQLEVFEALYDWSKEEAQMVVNSCEALRARIGRFQCESIVGVHD